MQSIGLKQSQHLHSTRRVEQRHGLRKSRCLMRRVDGPRIDAADYHRLRIPPRRCTELRHLAGHLPYPGQYFDAESRLHYNYFRDYEPGTGRYVQSDLIGVEGGVNTYLYSAASLPIYFDYLGLMRQCSKGGKKNVGTEGFNKNSDPKEVERALKDAKRNGQKSRAAALRALLKVIKR